MPFILASDETHLTTYSGSKVAWPVYGTNGNIPKAIRRRPSEQAMMLIGIIPVAKLEWITDEKVQQTKRWELYNTSLALILEPLKVAARDGIEVQCADGGGAARIPYRSLAPWRLAGTCPRRIDIYDAMSNLRCPVS